MCPHFFCRYHIIPAAPCQVRKRTDKKRPAAFQGCGVQEGGETVNLCVCLDVAHEDGSGLLTGRKTLRGEVGAVRFL